MRIFEFSNYKEFLRDFIENQPKRGRGLIKLLGENLGIDPSQVSQVLSGNKDFTEEQAIQVTFFCGLNEIESDYFLILVKINRSGSKTLKDYYQKKKTILMEASLNLKDRVNQDRILSDHEKAIFYSSFLYSAIRLSTSINDGQTITELSERFQVPREKINGILNFLLEVNLVGEKNGKYIMGTQHTHIERGSPFLIRHHQNWRVKALDRLESISEKELQFTGPVSISKKDFELVREYLVDVISKSLDRVKKSEPDDVACLLIDWFWIKK